MADNIYTINPVSVEGISQYERYSAEDTNLIDSFEINTAFDSKKNISELHIYTVGNTLLRSITNYDRYKIELGSGASAEGSTSLTLDPEKDAIYYGYESGGVKLLYLFLNNLFSDLKQGLKLYVKEISNDRTELKLSSTGISNEDLKKYALKLKGRIEDTSFFSEFRLNFGNNDLFIGINIDYNDDEDVVTIKLYEPLPNVFTIKSTLDIVEFVSNPLAYEIEAEFTPDAPRVPRLREANFNLELDDNTATPSQYFSYDELFSYNIENTNYQVLSLFNEKGAEISIDHTDYSDFIHFSSAEERLINFKYKLDLIKNYESSVDNISDDLGTSGVTNNTEYYQKLLKGVVDNFDHYERYLYFESGSYAWPKSNENKPYTNQASTTSESITWFANQRTAANNYDVSNFNALTNTIPAFIREDENNAPYTLFVHMLGQHFDNLYIYAKAVSDKYDADNRINIGVSRDLVEDAIKSLGVKLYNSSKSLEDLFKYFVGEFQLDTGEVVNTDVKAGQLLSGGTITQGPNEGFSSTNTNAGNSIYYPLLNSLFIPYVIVFANGPDYDSGFDFNYYSSNNGGEVFITITDGSENTFGPYKYIIDYPGTNTPFFDNQPGTINPTTNLITWINPVDADGVDRSAVYASLHEASGIDILIEDKRVTGGEAVTKPYQPTSEDIYQKSIYKRIYHNLPFLLKTKGTQRGLRALINCFGIPGNILKIKTYGGRDTSERPFFGYSQSHTVSNQKVRTDNTGSIVEGDTLSEYTSIVKTDDSYNQDLHNVEVGFSPSDSLDTLIQSTLGSDFTIDDYIGDPRDLTLDNYSDLLQATKTALANVTERYDIKDFVRLIKFFDNVVFKMIKDFVPARSTTDTGIIIKPHLLDRSKAKSISASATQPEYSGSIDTAFISGSHGGAFSTSTGESSTAYIRAVQTPFGRVQKVWDPNTPSDQRQYLRSHEEAKFDGDFANSKITVTNGELNEENPFKNILYPGIEYKVFMYKDPPSNICLFRNADGSVVQYDTPYIISTLGTVNLAEVFNNIVPGDTQFYKTFTVTGDGENVENLNEEVDEDGDNLYSEEGLSQYETLTILAYSATGGESVADDGDCYTQRTLKLVQCTLEVGSLSGFVRSGQPFNLYEDLGFIYDQDVNNTDNLVFTKQINGGTEEIIDDPESHLFEYDGGTTVVLEMYDNEDPEGCSVSRTLTVSLCNLGVNTGVALTPAGQNFIPIDFFFGYSDTTEYYVKIHTVSTGNVNIIGGDLIIGGGLIGPVTLDDNFINSDNIKEGRTLTSEYGVLLTQDEINNGIPNDEIQLAEIFLRDGATRPSNGFKQISFYAVEPGVENCEVTTGRLDLADGVPHARSTTLVRKGNNPEAGYICPCPDFSWKYIRVWYYTERSISYPQGIFRDNDGNPVAFPSPKQLAETNTQIFWISGNDGEDNFIKGNDTLGLEAARDSGGGRGNTSHRAPTGYYMSPNGDIILGQNNQTGGNISRYSYAKFNRTIFPSNISWTNQDEEDCDTICNGAIEDVVDDYHRD